MTRKLSVGAAALVALQLAACGGSDDGVALTQATEFGPVTGAAADGVISWKGIPFARPPVGDLRWKAPIDPAPWSTARDAGSFGNACAQTGRLYSPGLNNKYDATIGSTLGQTVGSEDCLYLNIWRPTAAADKPRPVIFWIHGGSNIVGYTADPMYDGAQLARTADAVVVSVNYRLGVFGFLNVAQLKTGDPLGDSGNFAILDQIKALRFVQRNIAGFGGDPGNVTVMGESAGATNTYTLLTSPQVVKAQPALMHRAIALSGGLPTASTGAAQGSALVQQSLIADGKAADATAADAYVNSHTPQDIAAWLRGKSTDAVLATVRNQLTALGLSGFGPLTDGTVAAADPVGAIQSGNYAKVPVLAGNCRDEAKLFPTFYPLLGGPSARLLDDAAVFDIAFNYKPDGPATTTLEQWIPPFYLPVDAPGTGFTARSAALTQAAFLAPRDIALNALKAQQANVWYYRFDWDEEPAPFNTIYGASHGFDVPFAFGTFGPSLYANIAYTTANAPGRLALSDAMMRSIGTFAHTGDPNNDALGTAWQPWPKTLVFDADANAKRISLQ